MGKLTELVDAYVYNKTSADRMIKLVDTCGGIEALSFKQAEQVNQSLHQFTAELSRIRPLMIEEFQNCTDSAEYEACFEKIQPYIAKKQ